MKIKVDISEEQDVEICEIIYNTDDLQSIINKLTTMMDNLHSIGYEKLTLEWAGYDNNYPTIFGYRDENEAEKNIRLRQEENSKRKKELNKQKAISNAKSILRKYGITKVEDSDEDC